MGFAIVLLKQNEWEDNSGVEEHVYLILDVSAVYAAIFKRYNKHKWRQDESSHN